VDSVLNIKGFDLERTLEMDPEFLNTEGEHKHDDTVTSVCIKRTGELDLQDLESFISDILQRKGEDIFRMKGVLAVAHSKQKFVYHAVHMVRLDPTSPRAVGSALITQGYLVIE